MSVFRAVVFTLLAASARCSYMVYAPNVGYIHGLKATDGDYISYLGIPYAKVNLSNPFGASIPQTPFEKVYEAFDDSIVCPQIDEFSKENVGSLDCLRLNIYVPNRIETKKKLAVLVHFYGGYFRNGCSARRLYGPKYLMKHGLIVVTFNYRVGPYGFLCLDTPEIPGNQGLKDQYDALKWIKNNIAAFGGNENNITVLAHSSGSQAAEFHMLSKQPLLFNRAILLSSSALYPHAVVPPTYTLPTELAKALRFETNDTSEALRFLTKSDVKSVIEATKSVEYFGVCIEKEFPNVFRMVSEHPEFSQANLKDVKVIAGFNNKEWLFGLYMDRFRHRFVNPNVFRENLEVVFDFGDRIDELEPIVRHFYVGDTPIGEPTKEIVLDFLSDFDFLYPVQRCVKKLLAKNATVYQYLFSYSGRRNWLKKWYSIEAVGATHADELAYLFDSELDKDEPTPEDQVVIDKFTTLWTNFAKYGDPTPFTSNLIDVKWHPVTPDVIPYININYNLTLGNRPYHERLAFWELFFMMNEKSMKASKWQSDSNN